MVGVVAGCQFAASLVARIWSGHAADTQGPKWAVMAGLAGAAISGLLYLFSLSFLSAPRISIGVLLSGRAVLGAAESFVATIGAALTGFGYAPVFPALGVEAVRRAPPESRGVAMGAYTACLDIALGVSGPVLGAIARRSGPSSVFLASGPGRLRRNVHCGAVAPRAIQHRRAPSMTAWAQDELQKIADADEYGTPTWIWSVAVDGDLYVRAYNGQSSRWYQAAMRQQAGRVLAAGLTKEVAFEPVDADINDRIDEVHRVKYRGSPCLNPMIGARARAATVRITPRGSDSASNHTERK
jgi:hypothetical protein